MEKVAVMTMYRCNVCGGKVKDHDLDQANWFLIIVSSKTNFLFSIITAEQKRKSCILYNA